MRPARIAATIASVVLLVALTGCTDLFSSRPADTVPRALVTIELQPLAASTILPRPLTDEIASYEVTLTGADETHRVERSAPAGVVEAGPIRVGDWTLSVSASDGDGNTIATSPPQPFLLTPEGATLTARLAPLTDGSGTLTLALAWPSGAIAAIEGEIAPWQGGAAQPLALGPFGPDERTLDLTYPLEAGFYTLTLRLFDEAGVRRRTLFTVAHIHGNRTTRGTYDLSAGDLTDPPAAPADFSAVSAAPASVSLSWTDTSPFNSGYRLERSLSGTGGFVEIAGPAQLAATAERFEDATVEEGRSYDYRLTALGGEFGDSEPVGVGGVSVMRSEPNVRYVAPAGDDADGTGTTLAPYAGVARALADLASGAPGEVRLATGAYEETIVVRGAVTIRGGYDPDDWSAARNLATGATVIRSVEPDGTAAITFDPVPDVVGPRGIEGITVESAGGGIAILGSAAVTIRETTVDLAAAAGERAISGVHAVDTSDLTLERVTILSSADSAQRGAQTGLHLAGVREALVSNTVILQRAGAHPTAGFTGIALAAGASPRLYNTTIAAADGATTAAVIGISIAGEAAAPSNPDIRNTLIVAPGARPHSVGILQRIAEGQPVGATAPARLTHTAFGGWGLTFEREGSAPDADSAAALNDAAITSGGTPENAARNVIATVAFADLLEPNLRPVAPTDVVVLVGGADLAPTVTLDRSGTARTATDGYTIGAYEVDPPSAALTFEVDFTDPANPAIAFDGGTIDGATVAEGTDIVFHAPTEVTIGATSETVERYLWLVDGELIPPTPASPKLSIGGAGETATLHTDALGTGVRRVTLLIEVGGRLFSAEITLRVVTG